MSIHCSKLKSKPESTFHDTYIILSKYTREFITIFTGKEWKVTTIEEEPYLTKKGNNYEGFIPDLMKAISEKANIDYKFQLVRDGKYGSEDPSGRWNGMVGELIRNVSTQKGEVSGNNNIMLLEGGI